MDRCPTIPTLGTILGVWAHPDDEAYLTAGLMALARRHGQRVAVVTATAGEAGNPSPLAMSGAEVAAIRRLELGASLAALGVDEHRFLGLPDGGCDQLALAHGAELVHQAITEVQPDTIVTFGPDGLTGHRDHRAVSAWTTAAWEATGRRARLWYATLTPAFHERWAAVDTRFTLTMDGTDPPNTPPHDLVFAVECTGALLRHKMGALRLHRTQTSSFIDTVGDDTFAQLWATEAFVDAAAGAAQAGPPADELTADAA